MKQIFIDKFKVPANAKAEFVERMSINRNFIKNLPGFMEDTVYESKGENDAMICITVAVWENESVLAKAKEAVQTEYQKQGFNPAEMFERLNITMERGIYSELDAHKANPEASHNYKEIIRKLYEDGLNKRNFDLLTEILHEDYVGATGEKGPSGFTELIQSLVLGFPDIEWTIEDLMTDGDKVTVRSSWKGTHTGTFGGFLSPTHKQVSNHAITIYQFRDGKIVQAWIETDRLGFLQQTGAIPEKLLSSTSKKGE